MENVSYVFATRTEHHMTSLSIFILVEATLGIIGNLAVLLIVVCCRDMHTPINLSFANLAVADLCVLFLDAIPTASDLVGSNISFRFGCRIPYYIRWVTGQVTCLTLAYLSYDRYRVVIRPFTSLRHRRPRRVWSLLLAIWFVSAVIQSPMLYVGSPNEDGLCQEYAPQKGIRVFFSAETVSLFVLPLSIMCYCLYHIWTTLANSRRLPSIPGHTSSSTSPLSVNRKLWRQRKRGIRVVTMTVLVFALGYAPIHSVHLWYAYSPREIHEHDPLYVEIHTIANAIMYFSNFMNPYIYAFLGRGFRKHIKRALLCMEVRHRIKRYTAKRSAEESSWI